MRALGCLVIAAIAGCGRIDFDGRPDALPDAPMDGRGVGPFGPVAPLAELNTATNESDPTLTFDLLEMVFDSDRSGSGTDLYVTTRASTSDQWGTPMLIPELNTTMFDGAPGMTPDGLTIYITSNRPGGLGGFDIWRATRASRSDTWNTPVHVPELSTVDDDSNPQPSSDDLHIWIASKRGGLTNRQLYSASRASVSDMWSTPVAMSEINTSPAKATEAPWGDDGYDIYFASNRTGGIGANDLWYATRANLSDAFGPAVHIDELSTASGDQDPWLSLDRHTIIWMSKKAGSDDLYTATR